MSKKRDKTPVVPRTYCWDTSVLLAWLNSEESTSLPDINLLVHQFNSGQANLVVSATLLTELLATKHKPAQAEALEKFMQRPNVTWANVTVEIAKKAAEIRDYWMQTSKKGERRNITTPDAQIIATAVIYKVDALHSMEPKHHKLNGTRIVNMLRITLPREYDGQLSLLG